MCSAWTSLPTYLARYLDACLASPNEPCPMGTLPSSLIWTNPRPRIPDLAVADVAPDGEVNMEAMTARVPLWYPPVRGGLAQALTQIPEELADIFPKLDLVMAAFCVGEGAEPVQSVGRRIPAGTCPRLSGSLGCGSLRVFRFSSAPPVD